MDGPVVRDTRGGPGAPQERAQAHRTGRSRQSHQGLGAASQHLAQGVRRPQHAYQQHAAAAVATTTATNANTSAAAAATTTTATTAAAAATAGVLVTGELAASVGGQLGPGAVGERRRSGSAQVGAADSSSSSAAAASASDERRRWLAGCRHTSPNAQSHTTQAICGARAAQLGRRRVRPGRQLEQESDAASHHTAGLQPRGSLHSQANQ